jgi:hypothetical protein
MKKIKIIWPLTILSMLLKSVSFANPLYVGPKSYFVFSAYYFIPSIIGVILATIFLGLMLYSTILMLKKTLDIEHFPSNAKKYRILKVLLIIIFILLYALSMFSFILSMKYMF